MCGMPDVDFSFAITVFKGFAFGLVLMFSGLSPSDIEFYFWLLMLIIIGSVDILM